MERYERMEKLGEGTYGVVYKGRDIRTKRFVALKNIRLDNGEDGMPGTSIREIALLRELRHQNVVSLLDILCNGKHLVLVFEFLEQDLKKHLDALKGRMLDAMLVKSYLYQLVKGIAYCHGHRVLHRDLKPQNLLLDRMGNLKLADFGLARAFGIPMRAYTHEIVTLWYRAPEVLLGNPMYSCAVDIWSIGCIFAEMVHKKPLFPGDCEIDTVFKIFGLLGTPTEETMSGISKMPEWRSTFPNFRPKPLQQALPEMDPLGLDLFEKMMPYEPSKRISAKAALLHPYFDDLPNKEILGMIQ